jgi:hypothetical protein
MTYAADLSRHYAEVRSRLIGRQVRDRLVFIEIPEMPDETLLPDAPSAHWMRIADEVACKHGCTVQTIVGRSRATRWTAARHEAMYRIRHEVRILGAPPSYAHIGKWLGGRHHSTILHGIRTHAATQT